MRYLTSPFKLSNACMSSKNVSPVLRPKSPVFTPVSTISLAPLAIAFSATFIVSAIEAFRLRPRANGIVQ